MKLSSEVVTSVTDLLAQRGRTQAENEGFDDFVRRGLQITPKHARAFLRLLQDGNSVEDAMLIAGIEEKVTNLSRLAIIARSIGAAIGTAVAKLRSGVRLLVPRGAR